MIKKITIVIAISLFATAAFATTPPSTLKGFNASKNVTLEYAKGGTSPNFDRWAAVSQHTSGDKNFFTSNAYGGLASKTVVPGSTVSAPSAPATATDSSVPNGWSQI
jgi:hypothetical protein